MFRSEVCVCACVYSVVDEDDDDDTTHTLCIYVCVLYIIVYISSHLYRGSILGRFRTARLSTGSHVFAARSASCANVCMFV